MSLRRGTPCSVVFPSAIRHAATIGSELFLLPLISTLPLSLVPPLMRKLSIITPILGPLSRADFPRRMARSVGGQSHLLAREQSVYRPVHQPINSLSLRRRSSKVYRPELARGRHLFDSALSLFRTSSSRDAAGIFYDSPLRGMLLSSLLTRIGASKKANGWPSVGHFP